MIIISPAILVFIIHKEHRKENPPVVKEHKPIEKDLPWDNVVTNCDAKKISVIDEPLYGKMPGANPRIVIY